MHKLLKILLISVLIVYFAAIFQINVWGVPTATAYVLAFGLLIFIIIVTLEVRGKVGSGISPMRTQRSNAHVDLNLSSDEIRRIARARRQGELEAERESSDEEDDKPLQTGFEPGALTEQFSESFKNYDIVGLSRKSKRRRN